MKKVIVLAMAGAILILSASVSWTAPTPVAGHFWKVTKIKDTLKNGEITLRCVIFRERSNPKDEIYLIVERGEKWWDEVMGAKKGEWWWFGTDGKIYTNVVPPTIPQPKKIKN